MLACNQPALSVFAYGECRDSEESQSDSEPVGKARGTEISFTECEPSCIMQI